MKKAELGLVLNRGGDLCPVILLSGLTFTTRELTKRTVHLPKRTALFWALEPEASILFS